MTVPYEAEKARATRGWLSIVVGKGYGPNENRAMTCGDGSSERGSREMT
jgi:hypothetical protein